MKKHRKGCPEGMDLLLPWYVNGSLGEEEAGRLEEHVKVCATCREELEAIRRERELYRAVTEEVVVPSTLSRLLPELKGEGGFWQRISSLVRSPLRWPRPALVLVVAEAVLIVALVAVLGFNPWGMGEGLYRTLSGPQGALSEGPRLQILFREDAPEQLIRETLLQIGGRIVGGPTPMGVYTVELPKETAKERLKEILSTLRKKAFVRFVAVEGG